VGTGSLQENASNKKTFRSQRQQKTPERTLRGFHVRR
jgi:hypothetical protein